MNTPLSPGAIAQLSALLMGSPTRGGQQSYNYPQSRPQRAQPRSGMRLEDVVPQAPQQGAVPNFFPASSQSPNPYPEAGTPQAPIFAQNPFPESGTQQFGGTPPFAPPSVQAALAPPSMPLVPPGALPPAQPQGLDPATFPSTSAIDQKITPNLGSGDMLEQWRRMMDQAQWARQGG